MELAFTLLLSSRVFGARLRTREWSAVAVMTAGVALLLVAFAPHGGDPRGAPIFRWALGCGATVMLVTVLVVVGYRGRYARRAAFPGIAVGIWFGYGPGHRCGRARKDEPTKKSREWTVLTHGVER